MRVAYIRVSTADQNEDRQREGLKKYNIEKEFFEKVSAKNTDRKELKAMMDFVREGDTVYIHDFSRLARSTKDLLDIVETLNEKGVHLVSNKENVDTSTPTGKLMLTMIGAIAEFERDNLLERQKEGIEIAKRKGKYKGRKPVEVDDDAFDKEYQDYMARRISKSQMARNLEISRPTLERIMREKGLLENK
ncbi:MAG: recombinase family protein [Eubacterium sp.]|nr:recombinase family protein [Eubacterium sp.]